VSLLLASSLREEEQDPLTLTLSQRERGQDTSEKRKNPLHKERASCKRS
jgi:hypothetical protein